MFEPELLVCRASLISFLTGCLQGEYVITCRACCLQSEYVMTSLTDILQGEYVITSLADRVGTGSCNNSKLSVPVVVRPKPAVTITSTTCRHLCKDEVSPASVISSFACCTPITLMTRYLETKQLTQITCRPGWGSYCESHGGDTTLHSAGAGSIRCCSGAILYSRSW